MVQLPEEILHDQKSGHPLRRSEENLNLSKSRVPNLLIAMPKVGFFAKRASGQR